MMRAACREATPRTIPAIAPVERTECFFRGSSLLDEADVGSVTELVDVRVDKVDIVDEADEVDEVDEVYMNAPLDVDAVA
jgi:hypothetical protein